jgi:hypothetical protein
MKKILVSIVVAGLVSCVVGGNKAPESTNLIDCENIKAWKSQGKLNTKIKRSGNFSFEISGKYAASVEFKKFIPVNPANKYILACYMRSIDAKNQASGYMGLNMYDENKKLISYKTVGVFVGTESELLSPAVKGAKGIIIKNNPKCLKPTH